MKPRRAMHRKRKHDPRIPAHIDQAAIPKGVYWDRTGRGRWYVKEPKPEGGIRQRTIAGPDAKLSEIHAILERDVGAARGTLDALFQIFEESPAFAALSRNTQRDYRVSRKRISGQATKIDGLKFGGLAVERLNAPVLQRLIDVIAEKHPTTALHCLQYLRRVFRWGLNRGHCGQLRLNPAATLEPPKLSPVRKNPAPDVHVKLLAFARERGSYAPRTKGAVPPYLWIVMELAYLCHMRGIEVVRMRESAGLTEGLEVVRTKGSNATCFRWQPRLRVAWDSAIAERTKVWERTRRPVPLRADDRPVIVSEDGGPLSKSSLDTTWQRFIRLAIAEKVIEADQRVSLHPLKRRGVTDRPGTKEQKQEATGHRTRQMLDVYDDSRPLVDPAKAS